MKANNDLMNLAFASARHATRRQELIARNLANADTPQYRALDLEEFSGVGGPSAFIPSATHRSHLLRAPEDPALQTHLAGGSMSPNGNDVSIETEMARGVDARRQHDAAMAIYKASLDILRTSLGRR